MARDPSFVSTSTTTQGSTPGTLASSGLYINPNIPAGVQGGVGSRDGRSYTGEVQQGDELVENRLNRLLSRESDYIKNARQRGIQGAAKRGLMNSSIAAGSAERSAIESGLPIASADAQTFLQTRMQNQQDLNQNLMQEREIANRMLEGQLQRESNMAASLASQQMAERELAMRLQMQRENLAFSGEQQGLDRQQQEMMARLGFGMDMTRLSAQQRNELERMGYGSALDIQRMGVDYGFRDQLANSDAFRQNWLSSQDFNRQFYSNMASLAAQSQINDRMGLNQILMTGLLENPEVFGNPSFISGMTNMFREHVFDNYMDSILAPFFGRGG